MIANNTVGYSSTILGTINAGYQLGFLEGKSVLPHAATQTLASFSIADRTLYDPKLRKRL